MSRSKYRQRLSWWRKQTRNHLARLTTKHPLPRLSYAEWKGLLAKYDQRCGYCWKRFDDPRGLWIEHLVPLSDPAGVHRVENVIPSCPACNQRKGSKSLWEFTGKTKEQFMGDMSFFEAKSAYATERLTVGATTSGATSTTLRNVNAAAGSSYPATAAIVEIITTGVVYTVDGTNPTSSTGHKLAAGDVLPLSGNDKIADLKMVRDSTTTDATVQITFYKW